MYNLERINKIIDDINRFFRDLESFGYKEENINDAEKMYASSMAIFGIMNRASDLAEEILIKNDLPMPQSYHEAYPSLAKAGLFDKKLMEKLEMIVKERGLFAHHYFDVNKTKVLKLLREIYAVKDFVEKVKKVIVKGGKNEKIG